MSGIASLALVGWFGEVVEKGVVVNSELRNYLFVAAIFLVTLTQAFRHSILLAVAANWVVVFAYWIHFRSSHILAAHYLPWIIILAVMSEFMNYCDDWFAMQELLVRWVCGKRCRRLRRACGYIEQSDADAPLGVVTKEMERVGTLPSGVQIHVADDGKESGAFTAKTQVDSKQAATKQGELGSDRVAEAEEVDSIPYRSEMHPSGVAIGYEIEGTLHVVGMGFRAGAYFNQFKTDLVIFTALHVVERVIGYGFDMVLMTPKGREKILNNDLKMWAYASARRTRVGGGDSYSHLGLDIAAIAITPQMAALLGIKVASFSKVCHGDVITAEGFHRREAGVLEHHQSRGRILSAQALLARHGATTYPAWSGCAIRNLRGDVIGMHTGVWVGPFAKEWTSERNCVSLVGIMFARPPVSDVERKDEVSPGKGELASRNLEDDFDDRNSHDREVDHDVVYANGERVRWRVNGREYTLDSYRKREDRVMQLQTMDIRREDLVRILEDDYRVGRLSREEANDVLDMHDRVHGDDDSIEQSRYGWGEGSTDTPSKKEFQRMHHGDSKRHGRTDESGDLVLQSGQQKQWQVQMDAFVRTAAARYKQLDAQISSKLAGIETLKPFIVDFEELCKRAEDIGNRGADINIFEQAQFHASMQKILNEKKDRMDKLNADLRLLEAAKVRIENQLKVALARLEGQRKTTEEQLLFRDARRSQVYQEAKKVEEECEAKLAMVAAMQREIHDKSNEISNIRELVGEAVERRAAEAAKVEVERKAKAESEAKAKAEARARAEADAKVKAEAEAKAKAEAEAKARAEAEAKAKAEAEVKAEAEAKAKAEAEAKAKADIEAKAKAEEAKAKAEMEAKAKAEAETKAKAEMEAKARAEAEVKVKAEMEAKAKAEAEVRAKAEAEAKAKAKAEMEAKAKADADKIAELAKAKALVEAAEKEVKWHEETEFDKLTGLVESPAAHVDEFKAGRIAESGKATFPTGKTEAQKKESKGPLGSQTKPSQPKKPSESKAVSDGSGKPEPTPTSTKSKASKKASKRALQQRQEESLHPWFTVCEWAAMNPEQQKGEWTKFSQAMAKQPGEEKVPQERWALNKEKFDQKEARQLAEFQKLYPETWASEVTKLKSQIEEDKKKSRDRKAAKDVLKSTPAERMTVPGSAEWDLAALYNTEFAPILVRANQFNPDISLMPVPEEYWLKIQPLLQVMPTSAKEFVEAQALTRFKATSSLAMLTVLIKDCKSEIAKRFAAQLTPSEQKTR